MQRFPNIFFPYASIMATEYGSRLKQARQYARLTQVQLAEKTGIAQSTISTAERKGNGSTDTAVYAQTCGVNAVWLETGAGEMIQKSTEKSTVAVASSVGSSAASNQCLQIMAMLATLPDDPFVQINVLNQISEVIAKARGSPVAHRPPPAYSPTATRTAKQG